MMTFATGLFIGVITGISISYVLFMWLIHNPYKRIMETKDAIIKRQELFINWTRMVLSRNRLLLKMGRQRVYLHDN